LILATGPPVSPRLREDFGHGEQFYARAGEVIELPERRADRPNRGFLEGHLDEFSNPRKVRSLTATLTATTIAMGALRQP
jgi:hypothetical protein